MEVDVEWAVGEVKLDDGGCELSELGITKEPIETRVFTRRR